MLQFIPAAGGGSSLVVTDLHGQLAALGTDSIEVWVSGAGLSITAPYKATTTLTLNSAITSRLSSGKNYQARLRPRGKGLPLAGYSAGHSFNYDTGANAAPVLDSGFSGAWYDPSHDGEGFIVEVHEQNKALVYWFSYTTDGQQRWMLGLGDIKGGTITVSELVRTQGGRFGANFNPKDVTASTLGALSITFRDCNSATVNYSVDQVGDHQELKRLSEIYGHRCGKTSEKTSQDISGSWFDPNHDGEGYIVQQLATDLALVFWFTYTESGEQAWMLNTANLQNGVMQIDSLLQPQGGIFGRSYKPQQVSQKPWGYLELELNCTSGDAIYLSDLAGFSDGNQRLVPLTRLKDSGCLL
jgi:hypothetical protein